MIGKLTGHIDSVAGHQVLLDVQGVGYLAQCSSRTLRRLGSAGEPASLLIEMQVREDAITLIGFIDQAEKNAFQLLTTVQGVGARVALSILSTLSPEQLAAAVTHGDKTLLASADGVGPKLAARLATELKDKAHHFVDAVFVPNKTIAAMPNPAPSASEGLAGDAVSSLLHLGYRREEAFAAVMRVLSENRGNDNNTLGFDELIRLSLKELSPR